MRTRLGRKRRVALTVVVGYLCAAGAVYADRPRQTKTPGIVPTDGDAEIRHLDRDERWRIPARIRHLLAKAWEELTPPTP